MKGSNPNLFKDIKQEIERLDTGMTFHQETCPTCIEHKKECEQWWNMIELWNLLYIADELREKGKLNA